MLPLGCLALLLAASLAACGAENSTPDAGSDGDGYTGPQTCSTDADCEAPETCQDNGFCEYQIGPKPDDNKLVGTFTCSMNVSGYGSSEVIGKFQGRYVYMEYPGCLARFDPDEDPKAILFVDGIVTSELVLRLVIKVPYDSPTDTAIRFGVGGVALGVFKHAGLSAEGYITDETPVAEVIGGQIVFGQFGSAQGNQVEGSFTLELKPIQQ
jgi:hypothetical protein